MLQRGRDHRHSCSSSQLAGRSLHGHHGGGSGSVAVPQLPARTQQGSVPTAVTAGTVTWGQVRSTRHLCASPGGRSPQWGWLCCHHTQSKMERGLKWLLQGPVVCSKHPCPGREAPQPRALRSPRRSPCHCRGHHRRTHWELQACCSFPLSLSPLDQAHPCGRS